MSTTATDLGIDRDEVERALAQGKTLPYSWYTDQRIFDLELDTMFARSWHYAGPLHKLREPGDRIVTQAAHIPIVVTRGLDGELHGLLNICRHRAHPVAQDETNRKSLQCRYHGWTYDLDGSLRAAPRCEREPSFDKSELPLVRVSVDTWGGFVFVNPDPHAAPLLETYPDFAALAEKWDIDLSGYRYWGNLLSHNEANWKVIVENLDCYHCPTVHPGFEHVMEVDPAVYTSAYGERMFGMWQSMKSEALRHGYIKAEEDPGYCLAYLFPAIEFGKEHHFAFASSIIPTGTETCTFRFDVYVNPECDEAFIQEWIAMYDQLFKEDEAVCSAVGGGLKARQLSYGQLLPASEGVINHFHQTYWKALAGALDGLEG